MTELQDIIGQIPMGQIAGLLGTDEPTARAAVEAAVPTLLAGMHNNAQAPDGAASLQSALGQHQDGLIDGGVDVAQVDTADGEKIVDHVFGGQQDHVASQLAGSGQLGGAGSDLVRKLLPILAPIVMSYLAKKFLGGSQPGAGSQAGTGAAADSGQGGGMDLGGVLGGILGGMVGGQGGQGSAAGQDGPGGQGEQGGFGGLGDILGGLFGKK
jgi:hypothetical protein